MSSIMTVRDLCLWYGKAQALKHINMEIPEKSITALIGPSGCGKSTFLKTLNRMNDLVSSVKITGEVMYNGENIYDNSVDVNELRKNIGMVFQKPNPFPMSIYDNIAYGPRTHGIRSKAKLDDIVERSLRDAAIWEEAKDRLKRNALGLSGGQQQRAAIARALMTKPAILLADEPTGSLDSVTSMEVVGLMRSCAERFHQTVIVVTHQEEVAQMADRVVRIEDGRLCGHEGKMAEEESISGNIPLIRGRNR